MCWDIWVQGRVFPGTSAAGQPVTMYLPGRLRHIVLIAGFFLEIHPHTGSVIGRVPAMRDCGKGPAGIYEIYSFYDVKSRYPINALMKIKCKKRQF